MDHTLSAQVDAQPYTVGDWAEFTPLLGIMVLGQADPADPWELESWQPLLTIAVSGSRSPPAEHRASVARRALDFIPLVTHIEAHSPQVTQSEGSAWYEMIGRGQSLFDQELEQDVFLFQAIGFGRPGQASLRVVGIAPAERRSVLLPRMCRLAQSIVSKPGRMEWQPDRSPS